MVCKVHTDPGPIVFDTSTVSDSTAFFATIAGEFSESVRDRSFLMTSTSTAALMLQRLLEQAERSPSAVGWSQLVPGAPRHRNRGYSQWLRLVAPSGPAR